MSGENCVGTERGLFLQRGALHTKKTKRTKQGTLRLRTLSAFCFPTKRIVVVVVSEVLGGDEGLSYL